METITATGFCKKCRRALVSVNDVIKCMVCEANSRPHSGLVVDTKDPGEGMFNKADTAPKILSTKSLNTIQDALTIMKSLPLPEDVAKFKRIKKIISLMEQLDVKE